MSASPIRCGHGAIVGWSRFAAVDPVPPVDPCAVCEARVAEAEERIDRALGPGQSSVGSR